MRSFGPGPGRGSPDFYVLSEVGLDVLVGLPDERFHVGGLLGQQALAVTGGGFLAIRSARVVGADPRLDALLVCSWASSHFLPLVVPVGLNSLLLSVHRVKGVSRPQEWSPWGLEPPFLSGVFIQGFALVLDHADVEVVGTIEAQRPLSHGVVVNRSIHASTTQPSRVLLGLLLLEIQGRHRLFLERLGLVRVLPLAFKGPESGTSHLLAGATVVLLAAGMWSLMGREGSRGLHFDGPDGALAPGSLHTPQSRFP